MNLSILDKKLPIKTIVPNTDINLIQADDTSKNASELHKMVADFFDVMFEYVNSYSKPFVKENFYPSTGYTQHSFNEEFDHNKINKLIKYEETSFLYGIYQDDILIGFINILVWYMNKPQLNFNMIYIKPEFRKLHIGRSVLIHMIQLIKNIFNTKLRVVIGAASNNDVATKLYKSLGFKPFNVSMDQVV